MSRSPRACGPLPAVGTGGGLSRAPSVHMCVAPPVCVVLKHFVRQMVAENTTGRRHWAAFGMGCPAEVPAPCVVLFVPRLACISWGQGTAPTCTGRSHAWPAGSSQRQLLPVVRVTYTGRMRWLVSLPRLRQVQHPGKGMAFQTSLESHCHVQVCVRECAWRPGCAAP